MNHTQRASRRVVRVLLLLAATGLAAPAVASHGVVPANFVVPDQGHTRSLGARTKAKKKVAGKKKVTGKKKGETAEEADQRARDLPKEIKKEQNLAPKQEVKLDDNLSKTKSLKGVDEGKAPAASAGALRGDLTAMADDKLEEELRLTEQLVSIETECNEVSPVRFRLGDLYWVKSERAFLKANDFGTPAADKARYEQELAELRTDSIHSYQKIVDDCPEYKEMPKVMYYLGKALMDADRSKEGAGFLKRVIKEYPDSEWVPQAWYLVGEFFFYKANDALKALEAYGKVTDYPKSPSYGEAVYKQGWCYINTGEWQKALDKFKYVIALSDDAAQGDAKLRLGLRKSGLRDYVRAYSNVGDSKQALKNFLSVGGKDALQGMLENLGAWYVKRDAHFDTVQIYRDLIKSFGRSTRLPVWQGYIVDATSRMGNRDQTVAEARKLTEYFADVRGRLQKTEATGPERKAIESDVREAEEIAENTLRRLAFEYYKEANKLKGRAGQQTLKLAQELHRHYLDVFPEPKKDSEVNYVFFVRFQYADILYKVEEFEDAAKNYELVVEMNPHPTKDAEKRIVLIAAEEAVRSYDELVQDLDRKNPPEISGTEPKPIPQVKQKLIDACQRYIRYVGSEGEKIVEIRYKMARIYYTYNHFEQAAPAFNDIVANHPKNEVACYSANLVLDIYNGKKDYVNLKQSARSYLDNKQLACGDEDRKRFAKIEESSTFLLVKGEYEEKKRYISAGNAYMAFYSSYPKSEYAADAVYNASVNYDLGNKLDKANEIRRFLVDKMPVCTPGQKEGCAPEDLVKQTLYNIAQAYERVVDFDNAARYLDQFAARFKDDARSKDAVFNAGEYRATLGDFAGGRAGREKFIKLYPSDPDINKVAFAICESIEDEAKSLEGQAKAGKSGIGNAILAKWEEAHDCYFNYIKNPAYAKADTDALCQAQYRRMEIMRTKTNYEKGVGEMKTYLLKNWPTWQKAGVPKVPRCAKAIAEIQLRDLEWRLKKYSDLTIADLGFTEAGKKKFEASIKSKVTERDALIEEYKKVAAIGVPEPALHALFNIGEAYRNSIDALLKARIPDQIEGLKLSNDDKETARRFLREQAAPIEASAVEAYSFCVQQANTLGVYNEWSVKALNQLNRLRPEEYPLVVERYNAVQFSDKLKVQQNGIVIADGESYKAVEVALKQPPPAPKPTAAEPAPATPPAPGAVKPGTAPAKPATAPSAPAASNDGVRR